MSDESGSEVSIVSERGGLDWTRRRSADPRRLDVKATRLEQALDWAAALAPSPMRIATSCCGMSLQQGGDPFELLGSGPPAVSSRSADLLIVAGSITARQAPLILDVYERMLDPRWVIAWGACAISGGAYDNYATISGLGRILPVDLVVPGCPPTPVAFRTALEQLQSGDLRRGAETASPSSTGGIAEVSSSRRGQEWPIQRPGMWDDEASENSSDRSVDGGIENDDRG